MYTQPQVSFHPAFASNAKYHAIFMPSYIASTVLHLSLICGMTGQPLFTSGATGTSEPFMDAEVFTKAHAAISEGLSVQADWRTAVTSSGYVFFVMNGIAYPSPAFVVVPASVMPVKSAKILLGVDEGNVPSGWLQESRVLTASRGAAAVQHGANLVLGDFAAPAIAQNLAQRALNFAAKVREIPGFETSIEGLVAGRAGLTVL